MPGESPEPSGWAQDTWSDKLQALVMDLNGQRSLTLAAETLYAKKLINIFNTTEGILVDRHDSTTGTVWPPTSNRNRATLELLQNRVQLAGNCYQRVLPSADYDQKCKDSVQPLIQTTDVRRSSFPENNHFGPRGNRFCGETEIRNFVQNLATSPMRRIRIRVLQYLQVGCFRSIPGFIGQRSRLPECLVNDLFFEPPDV